MVNIWNVLHNSVNRYFQTTKAHCYKIMHRWKICSDQYVFVYAIYIRYLLPFNKLFQSLTSWNNRRLLYHHFCVLGIQVWLSRVPLFMVSQRYNQGDSQGYWHPKAWLEEESKFTYVAGGWLETSSVPYHRANERARGQLRMEATIFL